MKKFQVPSSKLQVLLCALCVLCGSFFSARAQTVVVLTNNVFDLQTVEVSASAGYFLLKVEARQADGSAVAVGTATSALSFVDSVLAQPITTVAGTSASSTNGILSFFVPNLLAGTFTASAVVGPSDSPAYAVALLRVTVTNGASGGSGSTTLNVTNTTILNVTNITASTVYTSGVASVSGLTGAVVIASAGGLEITTNGQTLVFSNTVTGGISTNIEATNLLSTGASSGGIPLADTATGRVRWSGSYTGSAYNAFVMIDINSNVFFTPFIPTTANAFTNTQTFSYSGSTNSFVVPAGITSLWVKLWGGAGGGAAGSSSGGSGGFSSYTHQVTPGETLFIVIGQGGTSPPLATASGRLAGGFPNGGDGWDISAGYGSGAGGGSSALFRGTNVLQVAGGGGGAGFTAAGGQAGGWSGVAGTAGGGTQSSGGAGAGGSPAGGYMYGGSCTNSGLISGGGGGGYYGGGSAYASTTSGGGGSSFIPNIALGANTYGPNSGDPNYALSAALATTASGNNGYGVIRW